MHIGVPPAVIAGIPSIIVLDDFMEKMMKFNIGVAKLRKWINNHQDIQNEFEVSEEEAVRLWKEPSLLRIGKRDLKLLSYSEEHCA